VLVGVPAAAAAVVGGRLQQVVGVLHGVAAQVLGQGHHRQRGRGAATQHLVAQVLEQGHHRQRGDGAATQHLVVVVVVVVRGVQEAVVVAGGQAAVQLETPQAGVARIRRHRAVGTCDGYCSLALEAVR